MKNIKKKIKTRVTWTEENERWTYFHPDRVFSYLHNEILMYYVHSLSKIP